MVEKFCVGGVGILVFFIVIGVGMFIVEGKEECEFNGKFYILENLFIVDIVFVKVYKVDIVGNLIFCKIV